MLCEQVTRQGTQQQQDEEPTDHNVRELPESDVMKVDRYARKTTDTWRGYRGNPTRGFRNHNPTPRARCYICGSDRHLIARCPQKRCPRCGDKGHGLPECNDHKKNVLYTGGGVKDYPETAVVIQVRFNGNPIHVMLDTGAQPSVIDKATLETMNIPYYTKQDKVYGVGKSPIQVCRTLEVEIDVGEGQIIRHRIEVLDTSSRTAILGRDFLANFEEVCFDMQNFRVRLGESWKETATSLQGGQAILRAEVARVTEPDAYGQKFDIDPSRSPSEREDIQAMLERYSEVFAANPKSPGEIQEAEHRIALMDDRPIKHRPLRVSPITEVEISRQIEEMKKNGIIRPSDSPWGSRIILVKKKDGTQRFAVDYRGLNSVTKKDAYPMPDAKDIFDRLGGSSVFSTLDCASAYWSIPVREEDRELTAFVSTRGQFEFNRMPFGLCNSQATYQRALDRTLKDVTNAEGFVDDTIIHSKDYTTHLSHLDRTLSALSKAGIQLRADKCKFAYREVQFLGHLISKAGRRALPSTLLRIEAWPRPTRKKEIR